MRTELFVRTGPREVSIRAVHALQVDVGCCFLQRLKIFCTNILRLSVIDALLAWSILPVLTRIPELGLSIGSIF